MYVAAAGLFGAEILLLKALVAACFVGSALLCLRIARVLELCRAGAPIVVSSLLLLCAPAPHALYQPLAALLLLATLERALAWLHAPRRCALLSAALLASLCFATKQNVGLLALAALLLAVLLVRARLVPAAIATFAAGAGVCLAPVMLSGAMRAFADYAFQNKQVYVRVAGVAYAAGITSSLQALVFATPPIAVLLSIVALCAARATARRTGIVVLGFALAALASVYPRADLDHVVHVVPVAMIACWWAATQFKLALPIGTARVAAMVIAGVAIALEIAMPALRLWSRGCTLAALPHFHGMPLARARHDALQKNVRDLRAAAGDQPAFLLSRHAAFYYLATGLENPTPFDYPAATAFGQRGVRDVAHQLACGRIALVCMDAHWHDALSPVLLEEYVARTLRAAAATGAGVIYRR
ncbi:MAG: hypothetical protein U1E76_19485 [Planctomycetota bacterium]